MAAFATLREKVSTIGKQIMYNLTATHTLAKPRVLRFTPSPASGNKQSDQVTYTISSATLDANGVLLDATVAMSVILKRPKGADQADVDFVLAAGRDLVQSPEMERGFNTLSPVTEKLA